MKQPDLIADTRWIDAGNEYIQRPRVLPLLDFSEFGKQVIDAYLSGEPFDAEKLNQFKTSVKLFFSGVARNRDHE